MRSVVLAMLAVALCATACRTYPRWNEPLPVYNADSGYRFQNLAPENNSDSLFVVLTFSGGGTRAAALAYGVLEKLAATEIEWEGQRRRLLDEVDVISSVSGGSLPAMYFGLFGDRIFTDFPDRVLYRDVQGELISSVIALRNYAKLASPFYGRTDLMAEWLGHDVFEDRTYADLLRRGRRPYVIVNATDVDVGLPFEFTQGQFDLLYSDLLKYPVGNAVAASASYPGLLTPMTLRNYASDEDVPLPEWAQEALEKGPIGTSAYRAAEALDSYLREYRKYIHVVDGGVADNLGLLPVIQSLRGNGLGPGIWELARERRVRKVVIVTVNAMSGTTSTLAETPEVLDVLSVLGAVTTIPLGNFAQMQIEYLQLLIRDYEEQRRLQYILEYYVGESADGPPVFGDDLAPIDFTFIEVAFHRIPDGEQRQFFETVPTTFRLPRETVDRLRAAAGEILDAHPDFQALAEDLKPK